MELDVKLIELKNLKYNLSNAINNEENNFCNDDIRRLKAVLLFFIPLQRRYYT